MLFVQIELLVNRDPQTGYRPVKKFTRVEH